MIRTLIRSALLRVVIPALDSAILWAFGWRKLWVEGAGSKPFYIDPLQPDYLLLRDSAVAVASDRARKAAKRAAQAQAKGE